MKVLIFKIVMTILVSSLGAILVNAHFERLESMERKIISLEAAIMQTDSICISQIRRVEGGMKLMQSHIDSLENTIKLINEESSDKTFFGIKPIWEW